MNEPSRQPDLTLTLDGDGVIRRIIASETLAREPLDQWRGRRWGDTVAPHIDSVALGKMEGVWLRGDPFCFEVRQRFPSGLELPMEYMTFSLGNAGFIAIGRNLEAISDLRARLALAQQARERDYWKMRDIETRYRTLFDATAEAVALVRVSDLTILEANHRASSDLYLSPGAPFLPQLSDGDRRALEEMLEMVRAQAPAPGVIIQPTGADEMWRLRASLMTIESGPVFICQFSRIHDGNGLWKGSSTACFIESLPEAFVVIDRDCVVRAANGAFLELVQLGAETAMIQQKLMRWLSTPGADSHVVVSLIRKHGGLRRFRTWIESELGQTVEVEITGVGDDAVQPDYFGLLIRDVGHSSTSQGLDGAIPDPSINEVDNRTLEAIVRMSTEVIERDAITRALDRSRGNRTAAARRLGLSRQSLHVKLKKYRLDRK